MAVFELGDQALPIPCRVVRENEAGTWECINTDCHGGHWFRRIESDTTDEGNQA